MPANTTSFEDRLRRYEAKHGPQPAPKTCPDCGAEIEAVGIPGGWRFPACRVCQERQREKATTPPPAPPTSAKVSSGRKPEPMPCPVCGQPIEPRAITVLGETLWVLCIHAECEAAYERQEAERRRRERVRRLLLASGLPRRHETYTWEAAQRLVDPNAVGSVEQWAWGPVGMYLHGPVGTGKTGLAVLLTLREIEQRQRRCLFLSVPQLLEDLRAGFAGHRGRDNDETLRRAADADLLVLDDIGAERPTRFSCETLLRVIDIRLAQGLPTVYTSNFSLGELHKRLAGDDPLEARTASRIVDRIAEGTAGWVIRVGGSSLRLKRAREQKQGGDGDSERPNQRRSAARSRENSPTHTTARVGEKTRR